MNDKDRVAYSVPEAARAVGCSVDVIRAAINSGQLTPRYITRAKRVIPASELTRWVDESPADKPVAS